MFACLLSLVPVSQVEVGCPWARGLWLQLHPKVEEHPQAYQPATQPRVPLCPAPPPHYSTCHTEAETRKKKNPKKEGETLNQEWEGRQENQEKRYTTYTTKLPRHALLTKLRVHCKQNIGTWPVHVPKQHTTGQESAPMLLNNGKRYKCNSTTKSQHATKECQNTWDHSS